MTTVYKNTIQNEMELYNNLVKSKSKSKQVNDYIVMNTYHIKH